MSHLSTFQSFPAAASLPKSVFFLVPDTGSPAARDSDIKTLLEGDGWTVTYKDETDLTAPADLDTSVYGVLLISHGITDGSVTDPDAGIDSEIGIVWIGRRIDTDSGIENLSTTASRTDVEIVDVSHPITSAFGSTGTFTMLTGAAPWSTHVSAGATGTILGRIDDASTGDICIWAYEIGDTRPATGTFSGRRVITGLQGNAADRLDESPNFYGRTLVLRSCAWAAQII